jgi:general secretion pathway protein J
MPAVVADTRNDSVLTFTRTGWSNPAGVQRPAEQRVRYRFVDGSMIREHWLAVDPALNTEPRQRVLFTKVQAIEVRFLDPVTRQWSTEWPKVSVIGAVTPRNIDMLTTRPLAIEFTVVLDDWGRIQRLFEIPT